MNSKLNYDFFNALMTDSTPEKFEEQTRKFQEIMMWYGCAIREVKTKLEVLNDEFQITRNRNPIASIKSRIKKPISIFEKMERRGYTKTLDSIVEEMHDIAGVRVICPFIEDIYEVADMITEQDDIKVLARKDYIKYPKPNGYRSLHLIVSVPIFLNNEKRIMKVEIQLRTIAMDCWASLEHQLRYKKNTKADEEIEQELLECAQLSFELDERMDKLRDSIID